ncbi:hypothetical protein DOY81_009518, partial [Sarcophaga bullata]
MVKFTSLRAANSGDLILEETNQSNPAIPSPISNWEGLPNSLDAASAITNGYTYFFKGDKYYRFNDRTFS